MPNILVVGSINMDVVANPARAVRPGETLTVPAVRLVPGGKGANAAVAAARMGGTVRMAGAVGTDAFGPALLAGLADNGVDTRWVETVPGPSGAAVIVVDGGTGQNSILVGPGANAQAALPDGDEPFRWADLVVMPLEIPVELVLATARRARAAGKKVLLDPAPARDDLPDELWALCDWVSPNEGELALLAGVSELPALDDGAFRDGAPEPLRRAAAALLGRGVGVVASKLGARGAFWAEAGYERHAWPRVVRTVDTTAAGDAFTGALAVAVARGVSREEALGEAMAAGTLACMRHGAQPSLPTRDEVAEWLKRR